MLSLSRGTLHEKPLTSENAPRTADEFYKLIKNARTADVAWDDAEGGRLIVCSRKFHVLGEGTLADLPAKLEAQ